MGGKNRIGTLIKTGKTVYQHQDVNGGKVMPLSLPSVEEFVTGPDWPSNSYIKHKDFEIYT